MEKKKYWKGFEELNGDTSFESRKYDEFIEELPLLSELKNKHTPRRDFLKKLGFSLTAATIAASCKMPVRKAIPYVIKPEEIIPGVANYYASTFFAGGDYCSVLVKTREGRPIKIEGNELSPITRGGTSARAQASVLSLYDVSRLRGPKKDQKDISWKEIDAEIKNKLAGASSIRILSSTVISPSTLQVIGDFTAKYPVTKHVTYDAISYSGILKANEQSFGIRAIPDYRFDKANVIFSLDADFLGTWISPVEYANQYSQRRKVKKYRPKMSKHYHVEPVLTLTGSNADIRGVVKASQIGAAVISLYNMIARLAGAQEIPGKPFDTSNNVLAKAASELWKNRGQSLVVCGSNDPDIQVVVNGINTLLENYGKTISFQNPVNLRKGDDEALAELINELNAGQVDVLIIYDCNPVYDVPGFEDALKKAGTAISFNDRLDETTSLCQYACPDNHYLESWNDAEPKKGYYSLTQPTIHQLFNTRQAQDSLLKWAELDGDYYGYMQRYWENNIFPMQNDFPDFFSFWNQVVHDGVYQLKDGEFSEPGFNADLQAAASNVKSNEGQVELVLYEKIGIGDGRYANNPWLQELPDPISKVVWDNYVLMSRGFAEANGFTYDSEHKYYDTALVELDGQSIELPIMVVPGVEPNTIAIALGYGRPKAGLAGSNVGKNVFPLVALTKGCRQFYRTGVKITNTGKRYPIAQTQTHHNITDDLGNQRPIIKETTLEAYSKNPESGNEDRKKIKEHLTTLYPPVHKYDQGHHWGLVVDLNSCIGCGACAVACQAENNVPVVGKKEVFRVHEMTWLRIDRYFSGDPDNPEVTFQPMMCHHCDNAPCENVCPVAATNHSNDGLNQMAYNRCIGTRYCQNNCPFKVRRFNWYDYGGADSFEQGTIFENETNPFTGETYGVPGMLDELTRMVLNPDVVVRSRGVMEKCTFCVQRIQDGKLTAKKENRKLQDGEVKTACQSACPTNAIVFGDMNDKESVVHQWMNDERTYLILEELNLQPSVGYLTKVRNKPGNESQNQI